MKKIELIVFNLRKIELVKLGQDIYLGPKVTACKTPMKAAFGHIHVQFIASNDHNISKVTKVW